LQGLGGLQLQSQQIQAEQKGSSMGLLGSLAGDATSLGTAHMAGKGGADAIAGLAFL
jgi:hypothetical protein